MTDIVPTNIAAGTNFSASAWRAEFSGAEWQLRILLRGPQSIDLDAGRDAARHVWDVPASETATWAPGTYAYQVRAANDAGDVVTIESGSRAIAPDFAAMPAGTEVRSPNRIALDAIEAVIAKRATRDQERYRIADRELYRTPIADLLALRAHYRTLVNREEAKARGRRMFGLQVKFKAGG